MSCHAAGADKVENRIVFNVGDNKSRLVVAVLFAAQQVFVKTVLLAYLMEEHGLKQSDLPELGPQSVVSENLCGKRAPNLRSVKALTKRFHVPT